jgi:CobQ-like glutamine amidotransferase family enzyme
MTTATQEQRMTKRASAIDVFRERCEARALLFAVGEIDLHAAVDQLQADAMFSGLVSEIGQDAVQRIMSDAFAAVRRKE